MLFLEHLLMVSPLAWASDAMEAGFAEETSPDKVSQEPGQKLLLSIQLQKVQNIIATTV